MGTTTAPAFAELLAKAVTEPGILSSAYSQFHNYSLGNVLLAWGQCAERQIPLGPMATYPHWKELGRHVKKGEKALMLCQPVTIKRKAEETGEDDEVFLRFVFRNAWFVLAQTEGAELPPTDPPGWEKARALASLNVTEIPFDCIDGNTMGYARGREVAVSPVNPLPFKTLFHELAHVLLGHTAEGEQADSEITPRSLREAEAECVALLCCEALGLPGASEYRTERRPRVANCLACARNRDLTSTATTCAPSTPRSTRVCAPGPQPTSRMRGAVGKSASNAKAFRVDASSPGPSRGRS